MSETDAERVFKRLEAVYASKEPLFSSLTRTAGFDPGSSFIGSDLTDADLSSDQLDGYDFTLGYARGVDWKDVTVENGSFDDFTFDSAVLREVHFNGVSFRQAFVAFCRIHGSMLAHCNLDRSTIVATRFFRPTLASCSLRSVSMSDVHMRSAVMDTCAIIGCAMRRVNFVGAEFRRCDFSRSIFFGCPMLGARFIDTILSDTKFFFHANDSLEIESLSAAGGRVIEVETNDRKLVLLHFGEGSIPYTFFIREPEYRPGLVGALGR